MEANMKKILFLIVVLFMTFVMIGCENQDKPDTTPPYFLGISDQTYTIGDPIPNLLAGIQAQDKDDGDLTSSIIVNDDDVDWTKEGQYPVSSP
jgi:hypothetical protein